MCAIACKSYVYLVLFLFFLYTAFILIELLPFCQKSVVLKTETVGKLGNMSFRPRTVAW